MYLPFQTPAVQRELLDSYLLKCLHAQAADSDDLLQTSLQYMYVSRGMVSMSSLADLLGYSDRNIRRGFQKELRVCPKELSDIIRFQSLLRELNNGSQSHFADVAVKYGYYDQAHLINQFKRYYGLTPNQVFKQVKSKETCPFFTIKKGGNRRSYVKSE